ncbi:MAG: hypothetical protein AAGC53_23640, partial [Actinomycetota bacterium]
MRRTLVGCLAWMLAVSVVAVPPLGAQDIEPAGDRGASDEVGPAWYVGAPVWKPAVPQSGLPNDVFDEHGDLVYDDLAAAPAAIAAVVDVVADGFVEGASLRIESETTESVEVFANPDGSRTAVMSAGPVRARDEAGVWAPIDTSLARDASGDFVAENTSVDVTVLATPEEVGASTVMAEVSAADGADVVRVG